MLGIVFAGAAGISKERELSHEQKLASIKEFNLKLGLGVATFCGIMSSCFAFGLDAGNPIKALTLAHGTSTMWQGLPVLVVVLAGGFTTNFIWCAILNTRNRSYGEYLRIPAGAADRAEGEHPPLENPTDAASTEMALEYAAHPRHAPSLTLELPVFRAGRGDLVHAVLLLHDGRDADGAVQIFQLDAAHGQHHHLQHACGESL